MLLLYIFCTLLPSLILLPEFTDYRGGDMDHFKPIRNHDPPLEKALIHFESTIFVHCLNIYELKEVKGRKTPTLPIKKVL